VAGGQVDITVQGIATVAALAKGGKLKLIGVMADQRHPEYPDTPTLKEAGIQSFEYSTWFGITLPKGTPKDITDRLNAEVVKALADTEIRQRFAAVGLRPEGSSPQAMAGIVRDQLARYGKAIKDNGIKGD
jgi:tripartite-type tricarboxylate transporter receptor subunit TctC